MQAQYTGVQQVQPMNLATTVHKVQEVYTKPNGESEYKQGGKWYYLPPGNYVFERNLLNLQNLDQQPISWEAFNQKFANFQQQANDFRQQTKDGAAANGKGFSHTVTTSHSLLI